MTMTFSRNLIENGIPEPKDVPTVAWPYPYANPKIIDAANNEAGMLFLTMPELEEWEESRVTAADNGFFWAHEYMIPEESSSSVVTGKTNQMTAGDYPAGFEFKIKTDDTDNGLNHAVGFQNFFDFTEETLGASGYEFMADALKNGANNGEIIYYEGWYLPEYTFFTDFGIRIYSNISGTETDITDRFSYGLYLDEGNNRILLSYGAVMVDGVHGLEGEELLVGVEEEIIWSDEIDDGDITGEWWITYDGPLMAGGAGTYDNPYQIETAEQLDRVRLALDRHYELTNDIDLSGYENWEPIGTFVPASDDPGDAENPDLEKAFTGTFNGNGREVSNMKIDRPEGQAVGLFGCVVGATVTKEIELSNINCNNCMNNVKRILESVGGVIRADVNETHAVVFLSEDVADDELLNSVNSAGHNFRADAANDIDGAFTIYDLIVTDAEITGSTMVGGVVGFASTGTLDYVILQGTSTIEGTQMVGGVVGGGFCDLSRCTAYADILANESDYGGYITSPSMIGVLAGGMEGSSLTDCYADGSITVTGNNSLGIGGLAGCVFDGPVVDNCTADVRIDAQGENNKLIGGLLGFAGTYDEDNPTVISDCEAGAEIILSDSAFRVGGLVGGGFYATQTEMDMYKEYYSYLPKEEFDELMSELETYLNPSRFVIDKSTTSGAITGGLEFIGAIAGFAGGSVVEEDCFSEMTLDGEAFTYIGAAAFAGSGTSDDPYQIESAKQLDKVRYGLDKSYILTADIDLSEYTEWEPIGAYVPDPDDDEMPVPEMAFTGTFDGGSFTLSNISIDQENGWGVGLFGCAFEAGISHLTVENVDVTGSALVGGVVGYAVDCDLENVDLSGDENTIRGRAMVGGLVGGGFADLVDCRASGNIVVSGEEGQNAGILSGGMEASSFVNCTAEGTITADGDNVHGLGGLAGCAMESTLVENCSANVTIVAEGENNQLIGGLLGFSGTSDQENPTLISECNVEADISADASASRIGGIIGGGFFRAGYESYYPVPTVYAITNCETTGTINGSSNAVGSIAGHSYKSTVTHCTGSMTDGTGPLPEIGEIQPE